MCSIGYHNCPVCGEEYKCDQHDSECAVISNYGEPCQKCQYYEEELQKDEQRRYRRMMEERLWWEEHGFKS